MKTPLLVRFAFLSLALGFPVLLSSCTPSESGGVTADGYSAPAPVSPIEATEAMRSKYREFR
ncbi:MAG: hypothetical protein GXX91_09315 [Verrucomicrobiaceae bacterium]|nr:hypothetical protein [Verrucomicrobiaceae bacterium]